MRTSEADGQEYPPLLSQVQSGNAEFFMDLPSQQQMTCPANNSGCATPDISTFYALGSGRFNLHIGEAPVRPHVRHCRHVHVGIDTCACMQDTCGGAQSSCAW